MTRSHDAEGRARRPRGGGGGTTVALVLAVFAAVGVGVWYALGRLDRGGARGPAPGAVTRGGAPDTVRVPDDAEAESADASALAPAPEREGTPPRPPDPADTTPAAELDGPYENPIHQQVPFGQMSYYLAPWRAYMDTWPARQFLNCLGSVVNGVSPDEADATAEALARAGIGEVRIEVGWGSFSYEDPSRMGGDGEERLAKSIRAYARHGVRPLILLNANSGWPCPIRSFRVGLKADAAAGAREIAVDRTAEIVPGRTGLRGQDYMTGCPLIMRTDAATGRCELSAPLKKPLAAGSLELCTLRYAPFAGTVFADGTPNPAAKETFDGWMTYVKAICRIARDALGTEGAADAGFDLEVWNEYTFGSHFLEDRWYHEPERQFAEQFTYERHGGWKKVGHESILPMTIDFANDPANGLPGVRVIDGFANQRPWESGSGMWPGQAGFSRHYYTGTELREITRERHVKDQEFTTGPIGADGKVDGVRGGREWHWVRSETTFIPEHVMSMPEYWHHAYQTEFITRDVQPFPGPWGGHHRYSHNGDGNTAEVWRTETNYWRWPMAERLMKETGCNGGDPRLVKLLHHVGAKATLRIFTFRSHKGESTNTLYNAKGGDTGFGLVADAFFGALMEFASAGTSQNVGAVFTGEVAIPREGEWTFFTESDDGSRLFVDGKRVVDNGGLHGMVERAGKVRLDAGRHDLRVEYYQGEGGLGLVARWEGPGTPKGAIPQGALSSGGKPGLAAAYYGLESVTPEFPDFAKLEPYKRDTVEAVDFMSAVRELTDRARALVGPQLESLGRVSRLMRTGEPLDVARKLEVARLVEREPRLVWKGEGTPGRPDHFHRDDFAVLPFQLAADRFAVGYYVVTRNAVKAWDEKRDPLDPARYDMPPQEFDLTLSNVRGERATVLALDPMTGETLEVRKLAGDATTLAVRLVAVDYPRLLIIEESRPGPLVLRPRLVKRGKGARLTFATNVEAPATVTWGPHPYRKGGSKGGITGEYFAGMNFETPKLTRKDPLIAFDWGGAPAEGMPADAFSVRWTGKLIPAFSEEYTFHTVSDDGVRLWVDGKKRIENWTNHGATEDAGTAALEKGRAYDVIMEYYENSHGATARLLWSSASQKKEPVPFSSFDVGDGPRDGLAELTAALEHSVDIEELGPTGAVRVTVEKDGLTCRWPQWDWDVAGVLGFVGARQAEAGAGGLDLPKLFPGKRPEAWELEPEAAKGWTGAGGDRSRRIGGLAARISFVRGGLEGVTALMPTTSVQDSVSAYAVDWGGAPAWRVDVALDATAHPGERDLARRLLVAPVAEGHLVLHFAGTAEAFARAAAAMEEAAKDVRFR